MKAPQKKVVKARLKLVAVGDERMLFVRLLAAGSASRERKHVETAIEAIVPDHKFASDGETLQVRGARIGDVVALIERRCIAVYDPNLARSLTALPNPWQMDEEPARDFGHRAVIYMAKVWHPEFAEALAFQLPKYDDDFLIELRHVVPPQWRRYRADLELWAVADHYEPAVHEVLDRFYECWWDEFFGGDEWNVLPPPAVTAYPTRALSEQEFRTLGVPAFCSVAEINEAYRVHKEAYNDRRMAVEEWMDIETAYERIRRHHSPREETFEALVAPRELTALLRSAFPDAEDKQVRWYHSHNHMLGGIPATLAQSAEGQEQIAMLLRLLTTMAPQ